MRITKEPEVRKQEILDTALKLFGVPENNIIVISCNTGKIRNLKDIRNKKIFLPKKTGKIDYYDGAEIGFDFDITDEENILYRSRKIDFYTMITTALERIE